MGRRKNDDIPRMVEDKLLKLYQIMEYNNKTGETKEVNEIPEEYNQNIFYYDYKEVDFLSCYGAITDVQKFVNAFNSIPNKDKYIRIFLQMYEGHGLAYPTFVGIRNETQEDIDNRKVEKQKLELERQKKKEEKAVKVLENKKKKLQQLQEELK